MKPKKEFKQAKLNILTPSGKCPAKLTGTDEDSVFDWAEAVKRHGKKRHRNYSISALCYFVRDFFPIYSDEYKKVKLEIANLYG